MSPQNNEYQGRHRPNGFGYLAKYLQLEADAKRNRYHYFPRHNAEVAR